MSADPLAAVHSLMAVDELLAATLSTAPPLTAAGAATDGPAEACAVCHLPGRRNFEVTWCAVWAENLCPNCRWARTERELANGQTPEEISVSQQPGWMRRPDLPAEETIIL